VGFVEVSLPHDGMHGIAFHESGALARPSAARRCGHLARRTRRRCGLRWRHRIPHD
jgi:hypothetical protein